MLSPNRSSHSKRTRKLMKPIFTSPQSSILDPHLKSVIFDPQSSPQSAVQSAVFNSHLHIHFSTPSPQPSPQPSIFRLNLISQFVPSLSKSSIFNLEYINKTLEKENYRMKNTQRDAMLIFNLCKKNKLRTQPNKPSPPQCILGWKTDKSWPEPSSGLEDGIH